MGDLPIPHVEPGGEVRELDFMEHIRRALCAPSRATRVWRQNAGGVVTRNRAGKVTGRFNAGPMAGAADLSGVAQVTVGGATLGLRLEVEVKVDAPVSEDQERFHAAMRKLGAVALVVRYDHSLTIAANVARAVEQVDAAIAARTGVHHAP